LTRASGGPKLGYRYNRYQDAAPTDHRSVRRYLAAAGLRLEAVVIGGSALALLGVVARPTRDFDVLVPPLPPEIVEAARAFAGAQRRRGVDLADDWLNNDPAQLGDVLPTGWRERVLPVFKGRAILLTTLGRADLIKSKLFALCDRGTDLTDCVALAPTAEELLDAAPWVTFQDGNPDWPLHVQATLDHLRRRLGHGV
jgi:hypothetical protein